MKIKKQKYYTEKDSGYEEFLCRVVRIDGNKVYFMGINNGSEVKLTDDEWVDSDYIYSECREVDAYFYYEAMKKFNSDKSPSQYSVLNIDTVDLSKANDTEEEQLAICRFMIDKYNRRQKNQDLSDIDKLIYYANWKKEILTNSIK